MAKNLCYFAKHILIFKPPKKSTLLLTMAVFMFLVVFGVYIFSVRLRQISAPSTMAVQSLVEPSEKPYLSAPSTMAVQSLVEPSEKPYLSAPSTMLIQSFVEPSEKPYVSAPSTMVVQSSVEPSEKPYVSAPSTMVVQSYVEPSKKPYVSAPSTGHSPKPETYVEPSEMPSVHLSQINASSNKPETNVEPSEEPFVHLNETVTTRRQQALSQCKQPYVEPSEKPFVHFPKPKTFSRAECACNPVRFFVTLSIQRSGTGWFGAMLSSHTNISSNGDVLFEVRQSSISTNLETLDKLYNLELFTRASKNECTAAVGFKWMLNQGPMQYHKEIVEYFNRRGVSVIFLFRRNLLRRMISNIANNYDVNAKQLNGIHKAHVHSSREAEMLARYKPNINVKLLIPQLRHAEQTVAKALEYFNSTRHIVLYYEDIVKNRTKMMEVQDFLRVPRMELKTGLLKIHKGSLSSMVDNWEDVKKRLKGTPYERFLQSDYEM